MNTIELPHGRLSYRATGPEDSTAPPVVFVHAFLVDGSVWSPVAALLATQGIRSFAPDWPLGAHRTPMHRDADQSPRGVASQVIAFLDALDLHDVTLVGSDTGGALAQYALDTDRSRIGRVVFLNCDAFDTFPPFPFSMFFSLLRGNVRMRMNLLPMRSRAFRHSPLGLGLLANELDADQTRSWIEPSLTDREIREDAVRFLKTMDRHELLEVSTRMQHIDVPVRVVWGMADRAFKPALGRRLAGVFPSGEFIEVAGARTFVQLDEPAVVADSIATLAGAGRDRTA
jgi:pimeloyl-ACP methyl ester carboxylesterase